MIRAILPHPILSLMLFGASVLMSASVAPPSLALAALAALAAPHVMRVLDVSPVKVGKPLVILSLAGVVMADVVRSNLVVARLIIMGDKRRAPARVNGFVHIPLALRNRYALGILAIIITSTPGTIWVEYEEASGVLLLHILDLRPEDDWASLIKDAYERRLMEIFE